MSQRRTAVLDAAIELLGEQGMRALTHRAVDAAAGLPVGSTSNCFRTKEALLLALVERFSARERAGWEELAARACPLTPAQLASTLAELARRSTGPQRSLTLARYVLLVEGAQNPALQGQLAATGARVNAWFGQWLRVIGSSDPERDVQVIGNYVTGLVLHELAHPTAAFDPTQPLTELIEMLVPAARVPDALRAEEAS
jgi:DNA-binding transcriptional regulator YbjK